MKLSESEKAKPERLGGGGVQGVRGRERQRQTDRQRHRERTKDDDHLTTRPLQLIARKQHKVSTMDGQMNIKILLKEV